jgi:hypothetical protein
MRHAFAVSDNSRIRASSMSSSRRSIFKVWVDRCVSLYFSFLIIAVFTFSDIYFVGVGRVFDYIVLASIILFIAFCDFSISRRSFSSSVLLSAILFPWLLVGGINGYYLASAAVLVGALIVFPFFQSNVERQSDTFHSALKYAVVINIIMLVTQTYLFYFHGFFFDIHTIIGSIESRGFNESLRYFRPSGFFQEPNAYCAVMFCLLSIRVCFRQANWVNNRIYEGHFSRDDHRFSSLCVITFSGDKCK